MRLCRRRAMAIAIGAVLVTACGGGASPPPATEPTSPASAAASGAPSEAADICTNPGLSKPGTTLTFASFGGVYQKAVRQAWLEPYSKLTGIMFIESEDVSNATVKAQVESGQVTWDVAEVGNDFGLEANKDVLEPLDFSLIHKDEILPGFVGPYRVASIIFGTVVAYRTDKTAGLVPQGWADFFDLQKFPGKRGIFDYSAGGIFEVALMADGVAPKALYPLDIPRAIKKLDTIKDQLVFWSSGAKSVELIESGEVTMALMWNGRAWSAKHADNKPVEIQWNQQILAGNYFVVPKGAPNKDEAMKFIAWATCAQNNAGVSQYIPYSPTNVNAKPALDKAPDLPTSNANDTTTSFDDQWVIDNAKTLDDAYNAWKTK